MSAVIRALIVSLFLCATAWAQSGSPSAQAGPSLLLTAPEASASPAVADGSRAVDLSSRSHVRPPAYHDLVFGYVVTGVIALAMVVSCGLVRKALEASSWSLADALSEEVAITPAKDDARPADGAANPPVAYRLCASTSRFIAMFGLISILILYIGFGLVILNSYAATGRLPVEDDVGTIIKFIVAGGTLFAPYLINKASSMFDWLSPKK